MSQVGTQKQRKKISKFFFCETGRPRALIFGISHLLEDQVCSYDAPDVKTGPAPGVTSWKIGTKKPIFKVFFFSETGWRRDLILGMWHHLVDLYQVCS